MPFSDTDGTFTSAKDSAIAAGFSDPFSIGVFDIVEDDNELCLFECPYEELHKRIFFYFFFPNIFSNHYGRLQENLLELLAMERNAQMISTSTCVVLTVSQN